MRTPLRKNHGKITFVLYNKPFPCGGHCIYCFKAAGLTKSTTINEDTELARTSGWSGLEQISNRFIQYNLTDCTGIKCDLAVKGDSFANHDANYLRSYTKEIYNFLNGKNSSSLKEAALLQRSGRYRYVTFKIETRPDHINIETCKLFLELGITTVELGVQHIDNNVLEINKRGHQIAAVEKATKLLRTLGFEVVYQIMIGLPGSNKEMDKTMLTEKLWQDQFCPDALKIYPCLLLKKNVAYQKQLFDMYIKGLWKPINAEEYINLLSECYPKMPGYIHINRIQRIVSFDKIKAGVNVEINRNLFSNDSKCLWQRSVAQRITDLEANFQDYRIIHYLQGNSRYCFEAIFNDDIVLGYGRLEMLSNESAIIRDIRVLGNMLPVGFKNELKQGCQHIGIGTSIINAMENVARNRNLKYIYVKPSFGTIDWFEKHRYIKIESYYLGKELNTTTNKTIELPKEIKNIIIRGQFN